MTPLSLNSQWVTDYKVCFVSWAWRWRAGNGRFGGLGLPFGKRRQTVGEGRVEPWAGTGLEFGDASASFRDASAFLGAGVGSVLDLLSAERMGFGLDLAAVRRNDVFPATFAVGGGFSWRADLQKADSWVI